MEGQEKEFEMTNKFTKQFMQGKNPAGLLLIGGVGSGKTFMASSIANTIINYIVIQENGGTTYLRDIVNDDWFKNHEPLIFVSVSEMLERYRENPYSNFFYKYKECSLLILDDLGAEKVSECSTAKIFELIDYRYNEELPTIITTNCVPEELKEHVGARTYDRIRSMCVLTPVTAKSQRVNAKL